MPQNVLASTFSGEADYPHENTQAHYVYDVKTKRVLSAHNEDLLIHPASLVKLATATAFYHFKKNDLFSSSDNAVDLIEKDLETALIVSSNSAARRVEFFLNEQKIIRDVARKKGMGLKAHDTYNKLVINPIMRDYVGLEKTMFTNGSGLLGGGSRNTNRISTASWHNRTTARELSMLCDYIMAEHPEIIEMAGRPDLKDDDGEVVAHNSNPLLETNKKDKSEPYEGVKWGKTGRIDKSDFNLIVGAQKAEMELVVISIGSRTKDQRIEKVRGLLDDGFEKLRLMQPIPVLAPRDIAGFDYIQG